MTKHAATIDGDKRRRIQALPRRVSFPAVRRKAITIFVDEREKTPALPQEAFIFIRTTERHSGSQREIGHAAIPK